MYNPIYGRAAAPTESEVQGHANSWWVQADHACGYQSWHFHTVGSVLDFIKRSSSAAGHFLWRPYYRETGMLCTKWPQGAPKVAMAVVSAPHDGTG